MSKRVWKLQDLVAHSGRAHCARLGEKSGQVLASGGEDKRVNIWKVGKPHAMMSLTGHSSSVECLVFDKQEEVLVVGCAGGSMQVWNLEYRKMAGSLAGHRTSCAAVEFHPYGEFFASGSSDTNLKIWDLRRKSCIQTYKGHTNAITCIRFSPHGRWVATGGADQQVKLWDLTAGKLMRDLDLHRGPITSLAFHPKEYLLASGSADRTTKLWSLESFRAVGSTEIGPSTVQAVKFHVEEQSVLSASQDSLRMFSTENLSSPTDSIEVDWRGLQDLRLCLPEEKLLAVSCEGSQLGIWVADLQRRDGLSWGGSGGYAPGRASAKLAPQGNHVRVQAQAPRKADRAASMDAMEPEDVESGPESFDVGRERSEPMDEARARRAEDEARLQRAEDEARLRRAEEAYRAARQPEPTQPAPAPAPASAAHPSSPARRHSEQTAMPAELAGRLPEQAEAASPSRRPTPAGAASPSRAVTSGSSERFGLSGPQRLPRQAEEPRAPFGSEQIGKLTEQHPQMRGVLQRRLDQVRKLKELWKAGNLGSISGVLTFPQDHAAFCDFVRAVMRHRGESKLNLDGCQTLLPILSELMRSKYEEFGMVALQFAEVLLLHFGDLIADTRQSCAKLSGRQLDLAREDRLRKCTACYEIFREIHRQLADSVHLSQFKGFRQSLHVFLQRC